MAKVYKESGFVVECDNDDVYELDEAVRYEVKDGMIAFSDTSEVIFAIPMWRVRSVVRVTEGAPYTDYTVDE